MNHKRYFAPKLVESLTKQVSACAKQDEPSVYCTMDIFYRIEEQVFLVLFDQEHGLTEDDGDFILWDVQERGTLEEVVNNILQAFVEEFDIPDGGYYCRPIGWRTPHLETLIVYDIQFLSPKDQGWLLASLSVRPMTTEVKSFCGRTEYWVSFPPDRRQDALAIINRYVKN